MARGGTINCVGVYPQVRATANGAWVFALNPIVSDAANITGTALTGSLVNVNIYGTPSSVNGYQAQIYKSGGTVPSNSFAFNVAGVNGAQWNNGYVVQDGSVAGEGFGAGATCSSGTCGSTYIDFAWYSSGTRSRASFGTDSAGTLVYTNSNGAYLNAYSTGSSYTEHIAKIPSQERATGMAGSSAWGLWDNTNAGHQVIDVESGAPSNSFHLTSDGDWQNQNGTIITHSVTGYRGTAGTKVQMSDNTGNTGDLMKYSSDGSNTDTGIAANAVARYCGNATFSSSTTSGSLSCSWVTASSHCSATWSGATVTGGALGVTPASGSLTLTAATSNSGSAAVFCSVN